MLHTARVFSFVFLLLCASLASAQDAAFFHGTVATDDMIVTYVRVTPWPSAVIPVRFGPGVTSGQAAYVLQRCEAWTAVYPVRCVPWGGQRQHLLVTAQPSGCWASVGADPAGGLGVLNLDAYCWQLYIVTHEIGHAIGLNHEEQRIDRDAFISVNVANIGPNHLHTFYYLDTGLPLNPYHYTSPMHFYADGANPLFSGVNYTGPFGGTEPTPLDGFNIAVLYGGAGLGRAFLPTKGGR